MKDRSFMNASAAAPANLERQILAPPSELRPSVAALRNEALLSPLISIGRNGLGGHQVVHSPGALRLHPAFNELNLAGWLIHSESQGKPQDVHEPILITKQDILLAGFAEWHTAVCAGQGEIVCIQCALNVDEALQLILTIHRPRAEWNDFIRIELALQQESYFQSKALANQIAGGKHKALADLPKAQHIDVREKIADLAGVCSRTVSNVKMILKKAHSSVVEALHNGTITINAAIEVCKFDRTLQVEELARLLMKKSNNKTYREYIDKL
jgi:hypothetical protein